MVPPCSDRISRVPPYSWSRRLVSHTGLSPTMAALSRAFCCRTSRHWPGPRSLAATEGVSIDVHSFGYLDVSVPRVRFLTLCIQIKIPLTNSGDRSPDCSGKRSPGSVKVGFPIRKFSDQSLLAAPRDLTQRATSFIASYRQGIHQTPFLRLISTMLMHGERFARSNRSLNLANRP